MKVFCVFFKVRTQSFYIYNAIYFGLGRVKYTSLIIFAMIEVGKCLLSFGAESFVFQVAIKII